MQVEHARAREPASAELDRLRSRHADAQALERRGLLRAAERRPASAPGGAEAAEPRGGPAGARDAEVEPAGVRARREHEPVDASELQEALLAAVPAAVLRHAE